MIQTARFDEFVCQVIDIHNEERKDKTMWEIWLHRIYDKSFAEFAESLDQTPDKAPTREEVVGIIAETNNILHGFTITK